MFIVHANHAEGLVDESNDWYTNQHRADSVAIPGHARAPRCEISDAQLGYPSFGQYRYLAIYEIQGVPQEPLDAMTDAIDAGMHISESMGSELLAAGYELISSWLDDGDREIALNDGSEV
ncbi:hypothetical protein ACIA03_00335 [Nocardioides sp. NPDC051685]|uniref:hypothetical protein n=1 Tax=Nocardioides sp. NPDC051685 TaxID=3364334 RepID=UPI0037BBF156